MTNKMTPEAKHGEMLFLKGLHKKIADYNIAAVFGDTVYFAITKEDDAEYIRAAEGSTANGFAGGLVQCLNMIITDEPYDDDYAYIRNKLGDDIAALKAFDDFGAQLVNELEEA